MCSLYNLADGLMIGQISLVVGIYNFVQDVSQDERNIISGIYGGGPSLTDVQYRVHRSQDWTSLSARNSQNKDV